MILSVSEVNIPTVSAPDSFLTSTRDVRETVLESQSHVWDPNLIPA